MKNDIVRAAREKGGAIPAFNIPYLPMMAEVVRALRDTETLGMIAVARLEWEKFEAGGLEQVRAEYERVADRRFTRLHLDHVPVVDEDGRSVDYPAIIGRALELGYDSVMVDGSRLPLAENIAATRAVVDLARGRGAPVEAELGAIAGHEDGEPPDYETLFRSGIGFTEPEEARRFMAETGADWLSIAAGNIHGAISARFKDRRKIETRLDLARVRAVAAACGAPLVLHGGSGIAKEYVRGAIAAGIAKVNIATEIRQAYEQGVKASPAEGRRRTYEATVKVVRAHLALAGSARLAEPAGGGC